MVKSVGYHILQRTVWKSTWSNEASDVVEDVRLIKWYAHRDTALKNSSLAISMQGLSSSVKYNFQQVS
jgi:hypothetical protein